MVSLSLGPTLRRGAAIILAIGVVGGVGPARAAPELSLRTQSGAPVVGVEDSVEVIVHDDGVPEKTLPGVPVVSAGALLGPPVPVGPGRWALRWTPPVFAGPVRLTVGELSAELVVVGLGAPVVTLGARGPSVAGAAEPVELSLIAPPGARPSDLVISVSEGNIGELLPFEPSPSGPARFSAKWSLGGAPYARPALIAVADRRDPTAAPAIATVQVRARPSVPIQTQPGVQVELELGRRRYGPFTAGADGVARAQVEVRPGEAIATVVLRDAGGRSSTSTLSLAGDQRPVMVALMAGGAPTDPRGLVAWAAAVGPDGGPAEAAPTCVRSDRASVRVVMVKPGLALVTGPSPAADDPALLRLDCSLGVLAGASARAAATPAQPAQLHLRMSPSELEADAPQARVVLTAESAAGDRLPADRLSLSADYGALEIERGDFALRASYEGAAALAQGGDRLRATWAPLIGPGSTVDLSVQGVILPDGSAELLVRPRGLDGRRVVDEPLLLQVDGLPPIAGSSGATGEWRVTVPGPFAGAVWARAEAGGRQSRQLLLQGAALIDREDAAMVEHLDVPIFAGRVRSVFLSSEPPTVEVGANASARVRVRLVDATGSPVDAPVALTASVGRLGEVRRRPDGSYEAIYEPGDAFSDQSARITAASPTGAFAATSTEIALAPKELRLAPGLQVGWILGSGGPSSPFGALLADLQLDDLSPNLYLRLSGGYYAARAEDDGAALDLTMVPLSVGADVRRSRGRTSTWAGAAAVAAPYRVRASLDGRSLGAGTGLAGPGVQLFTGGGLRRKNAELGLEFGWMFITIPEGDLSWQGSIGGLSGAFTYRLLY